MAFTLFGILIVSAQDKDTLSILIQKHTILDQFEPDLVKPVSERFELKQQRIAHQNHTRRILDTLDISNRKRRRLLKELKRSPFSEHIDKIIMAETHFEDPAIKTERNQ
ncbi:hypothetical protein [Maribacter sp. 4G9]|uniref:hypothetical protein n=1 Tax=Maribacter sp. 4G9 TaxID=1889777 RepID=UPI000F50EF70|nr:hypothetical protein [Maribacter sp. 4G9]